MYPEIQLTLRSYRTQTCFLSLSSLVLAMDAYNVHEKEAIEAIKTLQPRKASDVHRLLTNAINQTLPKLRYQAYVAGLMETKAVKDELLSEENCRRHAGIRKCTCSCAILTVRFSVWLLAVRTVSKKKSASAVLGSCPHFSRTLQLCQRITYKPTEGKANTRPKAITFSYSYTTGLNTPGVIRILKGNCRAPSTQSPSFSFRELQVTFTRPPPCSVISTIR